MIVPYFFVDVNFFHKYNEKKIISNKLLTAYIIDVIEIYYFQNVTKLQRSYCFFRGGGGIIKVI